MKLECIIKATHYWLLVEVVLGMKLIVLWKELVYFGKD